MDTRARIAWNLRRIRGEKGVTQEVLAVDAGVDRGYVSGIEQQGFNPSVDILDRLATALSVDISDFFKKPVEGEEPRALKRGRKSGGSRG